MARSCRPQTRKSGGMSSSRPKYYLLETNSGTRQARPSDRQDEDTVCPSRALSGGDVCCPGLRLPYFGLAIENDVSCRPPAVASEYREYRRRLRNHRGLKTLWHHPVKHQTAQEWSPGNVDARLGRAGGFQRCFHWHSSHQKDRRCIE